MGEARRRAAEIGRSLLQPVINATGVIVHTNLGRAPLGSSPLAAVGEVASGYSNLEFRLDQGKRGSRQQHAGSLLAKACGAEAALVVNNNAAAVLLVLAALARGREVIVSRGELVEIGGGFRVPDVMAESGARLVEVGTTNRTRRADYERATSPETALILRVHASNYRMIGFVESTPVESLSGLGLPVVVDIGSGLLDETTPWLAERPAWLRDEPGARQCLEAGAALVTFSGDKLLGGPQAGCDRRSGRPGGDGGPPPAGPGRAGRQDGPGRPAVGRPRLSGRRRRRHPPVADGRHTGGRAAGTGRGPGGCDNRRQGGRHRSRRRRWIAARPDDPVVRRVRRGPRRRRRPGPTPRRRHRGQGGCRCRDLRPPHRGTRGRRLALAAALATITR